MTPVFQHVAMTVSDHERSKRFYTEALGFEALHTKTGSDAAFPGLSKLLGVDGIDNLAQDLVNGGQRIEMVSFRNPEATGPQRIGQHQVGLSHLCFYVDDLSNATETIEELGGKILAESKVAHDQPDGVAREYIMCTDPDGLRLLLYAGAPRTEV